MFANEQMSFDSNKFHQIVVHNNVFTVPRRYTDLKFLSAGAQGTVVSALDLVSNERVAIKKMQHPFTTEMNAKRAYREFVLLTSMIHPNIITLKSAFTPDENLAHFREVYLVMELMNYNLADVIKEVGLDHKRISFFVYAMLVAIRHLHQEKIIHRDLKPTNVVVNAKCELKILDFGLARAQDEMNNRMSQYVVTRYYRAPEVIVGMEYGPKVDVWAIGCIFAEMIIRRVLFPGTDRINQWTKIVELRGCPDKAFIDRLEPTTATYIRSLRQPGKQIQEFIPNNEALKATEKAPLTMENARDLMDKMLKLDPNDRISVEEAIMHPYVKQWYDEKEVNYPHGLSKYDINCENATKSIDEWKALVFAEVKDYELHHNIFGPTVTQSAAV